MIDYDYITKENIKEYNQSWPQIFDHPYGILIIGGSGSGRTNTLLNLIRKQNDDDYNISLVKVISFLRIQMKENINILLKTWKNWSWRAWRFKLFHSTSKKNMHDF